MCFPVLVLEAETMPAAGTPPGKRAGRLQIVRAAGPGILFVLIIVLAFSWLIFDGHRTQCRSNLAQIELACLDYAKEHDGHYPPDWDAVLTKLCCDKELACPASGVHHAANGSRVDPARVGYEYIPGLQVGMPRDFIVAYDKSGNHWGGRYVLMIGDAGMPGGPHTIDACRVQWWPTKRESELKEKVAEQRGAMRDWGQSRGNFEEAIPNSRRSEVKK